MSSIRHGLSLVATALIMTATIASARPADPPADAKTMLDLVVARVKSVGRKQAFFEFTARRPPFFQRALYVVCVDAQRVVVAHGGFATYVGSATFFKDVDGKLLAPAIWDIGTKGGATLRYTIKDEESNNTVQHRVGLFRRIKDDVCGVVAPAS